MDIHFINLTNGIEWFPLLIDIHGFIRIQSAACEQRRWWFIMSELDYSFLLHVALGHKVFVYDASAKHRWSRALDQGVEWIRYVLNMYWLHKEIVPQVNGHNCQEYFRECYATDDAYRGIALNKLRYVATLAPPHKVDIVTSCCKTKHDGDRGYFQRLLKGENE